MKLITETTLSVKLLTEEKNGAKNYFIEGIFMQSETKNRNGRMYPSATMNNEVTRYNNEYVLQNRAMGEMGHPEGPSINLDRVSHIIKELRVEGNDVYGRAKILDTPYGKIVKNLMDEGAKLGVSSRGMGSLKEHEGVNIVQEDFMLASVDVVADPSAPNAFVNGIMEGKEWIWDNGIIQPIVIDSYKKIIENTASRNLEEQMMKLYADFVSKL